MQIVSMLLVSQGNDTRMVVWHLSLVRDGSNLEPCYHPHTILSRLT